MTSARAPLILEHSSLQQEGNSNPILPHSLQGSAKHEQLRLFLQGRPPCQSLLVTHWSTGPCVRSVSSSTHIHTHYRYTMYFHNTHNITYDPLHTYMHSTYSGAHTRQHVHTLIHAAHTCPPHTHMQPSHKHSHKHFLLHTHIHTQRMQPSADTCALSHSHLHLHISHLTYHSCVCTHSDHSAPRACPGSSGHCWPRSAALTSGVCCEGGGKGQSMSPGCWHSTERAAP